MNYMRGMAKIGAPLLAAALFFHGCKKPANFFDIGNMPDSSLHYVDANRDGIAESYRFIVRGDTTEIPIQYWHQIKPVHEVGIDGIITSVTDEIDFSRMTRNPDGTYADEKYYHQTRKRLLENETISAYLSGESRVRHAFDRIDPASVEFDVDSTTIDVPFGRHDWNTYGKVQKAAYEAAARKCLAENADIWASGSTYEEKRARDVDFFACRIENATKRGGKSQATVKILKGRYKEPGAQWTLPGEI